MAPEGTQWPKRPESAAFDVIREQVGDNAHGPLVVARIKEQYRRGNTPVPSRLDALEQPAARTVTTGHQLCIAGGPAFTYYKIQTAISLAARLERRWGVPVLPVFWLASEDHDFEEVSKVWDGDGWRAWAPEGNGQGAVGRMATTGLPSVLSDWAEHVGVSSAVAQELASVGKANLADAMRHWVHMMFGQDRVIVLDGDDPDLKAAFVPVMEQEVVSAITEEEVTRCDAILHAEGTSPQVHVRSCNLFHLTANGRYRLVQEDGHWKALGGGQTWANTAALTAEMRADPAAFSPQRLAEARLPISCVARCGHSRGHGRSGLLAAIVRPVCAIGHGAAGSGSARRSHCAAPAVGAVEAANGHRRCGPGGAPGPMGVRLGQWGTPSRSGRLASVHADGGRSSPP